MQPKHVIDSSDVEVHLPQVLGPEVSGMQFHDHVAVRRHVVQPEIHKEVVAVEVVLVPQEGEARAELGQSPGKTQRNGMLFSFLDEPQKVQDQGSLVISRG